MTDRVGPATLLIPPEDIVLSAHPVHTSARNQYQGRIIRISDDRHGRVAVTVDIGTPLVSRVTPNAVRDLGLALGREVVLSFKAMAVRVY